MDLGPFMLVPVAIVIGLRILSLFSKPDARTKRALRTTPRTPISDAFDGQVIRIVGTVRYGERTLTSPLSGRRCALYSIVVEDEDTASRSATGGVREDAGVDFFLEDASATARIRFGGVAPAAALVRDREFYPTDIDPHKVLERFMAAHGKSIEGVVSLKRFCATEGVLEEGARVAVRGLARWMADPDAAGGSYRETPRRLVLEGSEAVPLLLSNVPSVVR
jgi:hypothetical protein